MSLLPMPVKLPIWAVATLRIAPSELHAILGDPHVIETDSTRTCGGDEHAWAYSLPSGARLVVIFNVGSGLAELHGDPPDSLPLLNALGISPDDQRVFCHDAIEIT